MTKKKSDPSNHSPEYFGLEMLRTTIEALNQFGFTLTLLAAKEGAKTYTLEGPNGSLADASNPLTEKQLAFVIVAFDGSYNDTMHEWMDCIVAAAQAKRATEMVFVQ